MERPGKRLASAGPVPTGHAPRSDFADSPAAGWPLHLADLGRRIRFASSDEDKNQPLSEAWLLLNAATRRYIRFHMAKLGAISAADVEDIAAEKSLEILRQIESGMWQVADRTPSDITGYLSKVARNGLVDLLRRLGREVQPPDDDTMERLESSRVEMAGAGARTAEPPDARAERGEFVTALVHCVGRLEARARTAWMLRVFADLSSKEIASHPEIQRKASHVDVILQRTRSALRECMLVQGHQSDDMPPGTFAALWKALRWEAPQ